METHWWLTDPKRLEPGAFFAAVGKFFPRATTLFVEGTVIASDVLELYASNTEQGSFLPGAGILSRSAKRIRCRWSQQLMNSLIGMQSNHSECEIASDLYIYAGSSPLIEWPDAFDESMWIAGSVCEKTVAAFAAELGITCDLVDHHYPERRHDDQRF